MSYYYGRSSSSNRKSSSSYAAAAAGGGGSSSGGRFEFGRSYVVKPKGGTHHATIVWLHGLGDNGASWSNILESLPLSTVKWICPTAPLRPVTALGGIPTTAWFDILHVSKEEGDYNYDDDDNDHDHDHDEDDMEGLDASAAHVTNLLSSEPSHVKLGVGGFSMGAAAALFCATCFVHGNPHSQINNGGQGLTALVSLSGWLPSSSTRRTLSSSSQESSKASRACRLAHLLCHGTDDEVVPYHLGEKSSAALRRSGFRDTTFKGYHGLGHYTLPEEMQYVSAWLTNKLGLP